MKAVLIFGTFLVLAKAQYPNAQYGAPAPLAAQGGYPSPVQGGYPSPAVQQGGYPDSGQTGYPAPGFGRQGQDQGGAPLPNENEIEEEPIKTVRHVFVHVAPDDEASGVARIIKAPIKRERQVSILFVKAPAAAAPDRQIVEIPNDGGRKTLVYVLLKKNDAVPDPDFKLPGPTAPSKPEIYFIKYKDPKDQGAKPIKEGPGAAPAAPVYGPPAVAPAAPVSGPAQPVYGPPVAPLSAQYGAPAPPAPQGYQKK